MYDEVCTGFHWLARHFAGVTECCYVHDLGGSDGVLLDCVSQAVLHLGYFGSITVAFAVFLMRVFQPIYNLLQRWGWVK